MLERSQKRIATGMTAIALGLAAATPAPAGDVSDTQVKIRDTAPAFHGKVKSDNPFCVNNRKVKLLYRKRPGAPKRKLGADRANSNGRWAVTEASDGFILKSGLYWAKVNRIRFEEGAPMTCRGDSSTKVFVD